jgi:hypothetical protein
MAKAALSNLTWCPSTYTRVVPLRSSRAFPFAPCGDPGPYDITMLHYTIMVHYNVNINISIACYNIIFAATRCWSRGAPEIQARLYRHRGRQHERSVRSTRRSSVTGGCQDAFVITITE